VPYKRPIIKGDTHGVRSPEFVRGRSRSLPPILESKPCPQRNFNTRHELSVRIGPGGEPKVEGLPGRGYHRSVAGEVSIHHSIHYVRVQTPSRLLSLPWESAQEFLARCIAAYPTVHPLVEQFQAVGVSRPVDLTDPSDVDFALAVIDAWTADAGGFGRATDH